MDIHDIAIAAAIAKGKGGYTKAETDALLDEKQDTLTTAQLAAANSGITAAKVTQYDDIYAVMNYSNLSRNGIFRGKDLTSQWVEGGKIKEGLYTKVHAGDFSDLYLGDHFTVHIDTDLYEIFTGTAFIDGVTYYEQGGTVTDRTYTATTDTTPDSSKSYYTVRTVSENVDLMIAVFNPCYNIGDTPLTSPHLGFIPRSAGFARTKMNNTSTTEGGYLNSYMHQTVLPCYADSLRTALNNHLLSHRAILPNDVNASTPSMAGAGMTGAASGWEWTTVELQLMNEVQVYGTTVWSSSAYDVGIDNRQLPVFKFITPVQFNRNAFWLRPVVSSTNFAFCGNTGAASYGAALTEFYVRPLILFG